MGRAHVRSDENCFSGIIYRLKIQRISTCFSPLYDFHLVLCVSNGILHCFCNRAARFSCAVFGLISVFWCVGIMLAATFDSSQKVSPVAVTSQCWHSIKVRISESSRSSFSDTVPTVEGKWKQSLTNCFTTEIMLFIFWHLRIQHAIFIETKTFSLSPQQEEVEATKKNSDVISLIAPAAESLFMLPIGGMEKISSTQQFTVGEFPSLNETHAGV